MNQDQKTQENTPQAQSTETASENKALEGVTINTTSVESKAGLYTRLSFIALWVLVLVSCGFLTSLLFGGSSSATITAVSVAIVVSPIFFIANSKRENEIRHNPALIEDVFVKKYLRQNLSASVVVTAIAAFVFVSAVLTTLFVHTDGGSNGGKRIVTSLVYTLGFGSILAFAWNLHKQTKK